MNADSRDTGQGPLVDWGRLGSLRDDGDVVRDIVQTLLDDVPPRITDVHAAIVSGSPKGVGDAIHRLKTGLVYVAADGVLAPLQKAEDLGRDGEIEAVRGRMPEIEAFVARFLAEVAARLQEEFPEVSAEGGGTRRRADG